VPRHQNNQHDASRAAGRVPNSKLPSNIAQNPSLDDTLTDVSVSPLISDDARRVPSTSAGSKMADRRAREVPHPQNPGLRSALTELQQLRNADGPRRFLQINPAAGASRTEIPGRSQENQPPTANQPFSVLFGALKQMNDELGGGQPRAAPIATSSESGGQLRLLRFPSPVVHDFPVKLPRLVPAQRPIPDLALRPQTARHRCSPCRV
jgi:hypothetical protein